MVNTIFLTVKCDCNAFRKVGECRHALRFKIDLNKIRKTAAERGIKIQRKG